MNTEAILWTIAIVVVLLLVYIWIFDELEKADQEENEKVLELCRELEAMIGRTSSIKEKAESEGRLLTASEEMEILELKGKMLKVRAEILDMRKKYGR